MEHFVNGWDNSPLTTEEFQNRMQIIKRYIDKDTSITVMESIIALVGKKYSDDGLYCRWPYAVIRLIEKDAMDDIDVILWSAFCYHNDIPFGMMIAYPHHRGMLPDENAYMQLMNTWVDDNVDRMRSMATMIIVDK